MTRFLTRRDIFRMVPATAVAATLPAIAQTINTVRASAISNASVPKVERPRKDVRGIWIHPEHCFSSDAVEGQMQVKALVQRFADANFNLILPWTLSGYLQALDTPSYLPAHPTAKWDALGVLIEEASLLELDVDLWYAPTEYRDRNSPEFDPAVGGESAVVCQAA